MEKKEKLANQLVAFIEGRMKKDIAERYKGSVSNGKTTVKVIMKTPPIDYRQAFEFLGGEDEVLNKDESLDSFRRTTGTMQVQIHHGEQL